MQLTAVLNFKHFLRSQSPEQDFCYTVYVTAGICVTEYKFEREAFGLDIIETENENRE